MSLIPRKVSSAPANLVLRGGRLTKWKGQVGGLSPHIGALSSGASLAAVATVMALAGGLLLAPEASAQTLSGAQTTTRTLTGTPLVVVTDNTFSVVTTTGDALDLRGTNGTSLTDSNTSTITGATYGIYARNYGTGALTVTTTGAVTGTTSSGIYVRNEGTSLTISTAAVSGATYGIKARNQGTGALTVTTNGAVTGTSRFGIRAQHEGQGAGAALTVTTNGAVTGTRGIYARIAGTGALTVTTNGAVTGTSGAGVDVSQFFGGASGGSGGAVTVTTNGAVTGISGAGIFANINNATSLTISAQGVTRGTQGIVAYSRGVGAISVTATGAVTGTSGAGIYARNALFSSISSPTDLTISAAAVTGATEGIDARNEGTGALSVTVSGAVTGGTGAGISTQSNAGGAVAIRLLSTSSVTATSGAAIIDGVGNAVVTIDAGAVVTGSIGLGDGNDTLNIASGVSLAGVTSLNGGSGAFFDELNLNTGWSGALGDWELMNINTSGGNDALGGIISGTGSLTKLGAGALTLSGVNTYAGGTTISAGSLIGNTGSFGTGAIVNNAALTFSQVSDASFASVISGTGSLTKLGAGALTLSGANTFSGGLTISAGSLIGNSGSFGTGNIVNNAALTFSQVSDGSIASVISGTGALTKLGAGALTLSGANTFSGGTTVSAGSLIGNTGSFGTGNIVNNAALTFNQVSDGSFASVISGTGSLTKLGAGALTLSGANTFSGGLTISAGNVIASISTLGSGAIVNNASLALNQASDVSFNSVIAGTGLLIKQGAGTLTFNGITPYSGGLMISAGSVSGAANNFGTGNIVNNAALTFNQVSDGSFASVISGTGALTKLGAGALTLSGVNTFSGGLTISAGSVSGAANSFGTGAIVNNAALTFNQVSDGSIASVISGTGALTKLGAGALTLTGVNTLTGASAVTAGRLNVTGSLAGSAVTVQSGASLGGNGTIGALTAQSGSTVSPGNSIGTLSVNGSLTLAAGSTLAIEVSPTGADRISATGAASIAGNLVVTPGAGPYTTFNQSYTLVSSSARTGTFAASTLGNLGAAFAPTLVYDATSVILRLAPASLVQQSGTLSGNALAVARSFDAAVLGGYNPQAFFNLYIQGANLGGALSQFSGELHSAERRVALQDTRVVREAALDRLNGDLATGAGTASVTSEAADKSTTIWMRAAGTWGTAKADGIGSRFKTDQKGGMIGADVANGSFKFGGMFNYTSTDLDLAALGQSKVESTGGALYAGYRDDASGFAVGFGAALASNTAQGNRSITALGLAQTLSSKVKGVTVQIFGEASYDLAEAENTRVEPFVRIAYTKLDSKALAETGGIAALSGGKQSYNLTTAALGLRGAYVTGKTTLSGSAGWQRTSGDRSAPTLVAMSGVNAPYEVRSAALDRNAVAIEAQASFSLSSQLTLGAGYSGVIGSKNADHGARATVRYAF